MATRNIHISNGNSKMGAIPSFSLPCGVTCSLEARTTCYIDCYYRKHCEDLYPNVRKNARDNFFAFLRWPEWVEEELNKYFSELTAPRLFRIHVGGDFFSVCYLNMWIRIAKKHPNTSFLAFTKQFDVLTQVLRSGIKIPENLSIVLSAWPGMEIPQFLKAQFPVAWMQDGTENRIPENAVECHDNCAQCGKCWAMDGKDVVFNKH